MTIMTPLRSVNKGAFLFAREGVISPIRANYMVKFYFLNHYNSGATWGLKAAPDPNAFENKSTPPTRIPGSASVHQGGHRTSSFLLYTFPVLILQRYLVSINLHTILLKVC